MNFLRAFFCSVTVLLVTILPAQAELRLVGHTAGRTIPVTGLENNQIMGLDGTQKIALPSEAVYELEGDLKAEAAKILWSPSYSVYSAELPMPKKPGLLGIGRVSIRHMTEFGGKKYPSEFLARWPKESADGGLVLVGWLVDGKVSRLAVRKVPSTKTANFFQVEQDFELLAPDEMNGQGIMLMWANGHFVTPSPRLADERAQQALAAMLLGEITPLRLALANGLKPSSIKSEDGNTMLHYAAEAGLGEAVDLLLKHGAKVNAENKAGETPLGWASQKGRLSTVELLLAGKANVKATDQHQMTALHVALRGGHVEVAQALMKTHKIDVNAVDSFNISPFRIALMNGFSGLAMLMLEQDAEFESVSDQLPQLLISHSAQGNTAMVRFLIKHKVDPNTGYSGRRALCAAAKSGDPELVGILLGGGARVNDTGSDGRTALMIACSFGKTEFARALLDAGADVTLRAKDGRSCLDHAVEMDVPELVELLLAKGADPKAHGNGQPAPLELALLSSARAVAIVLSDHGATVDLKSPQAAALLEAALKLNVVGVIRSALGAGWSAETKFGDGWMALSVAQACQATDCMALLEQWGANSSRVDLPLVSQTEIDAVPKLVAATAPVDPRDIDAGFPPAQVEVSVVLDGQGHVLFPVVSMPTDRRLAIAALQTVSSWRFDSITRGGKPVYIRFKVAVEFRASSELAITGAGASLLPVLVKQVAPHGPGEHGINGHVTLAFTVGKDGRVKDVRVHDSSDPVLEEPAIEAIKQWIFVPGEYDGKPADIRVGQEMVFVQKEPPAPGHEPFIRQIPN